MPNNDYTDNPLNTLNTFFRLFEVEYQQLQQNPSTQQWKMVEENYLLILRSYRHTDLDETTLTQLVDYFKQLMLWMEYISLDMAIDIYKQLLNLLQERNAGTDLRKLVMVCLYDYANYMAHVDGRGRLEEQCNLYQRLHDDYIKQGLQDTQFEYGCIYRLAQTYSAQTQYRLSAFYFAYALKLAEELEDSGAMHATQMALIQQEANFLYHVLCVQDAQWLQFQCNIAIRNGNLEVYFVLYDELRRLGNLFWSCSDFEMAKACYGQLQDLLNTFPVQHFNATTGMDYRLVIQDSLRRIRGRFPTTDNTANPKLIQWQQRRQTLANNRLQAFTNLTTQPIQTVQEKWSQKLKKFIVELCKETKNQLGVAPCESWAIMCLGSLARDEPCLFSDLEFAIIWDKVSPDAKKDAVENYFRRFVSLLQMKIILLGESNEIANPHHRLLGMTAGLKFDEGKNYPFSGDKIYCGNLEYYLNYLTPKNAKFQNRTLQECALETDVNVKDALDIYMLADAEWLDGDETLVTDFKEKTQILFADKQQIQSPFRYREILAYRLVPNTGFDLSIIDKINIKEQLIHLPQRIVASQALFYGVTEKSTLERIQALVAKQHLQPLLGRVLRLCTQLAFYWRMQAHHYYKTENDIFSEEFIHPEDRIKKALLSKIYLYFVEYFKNWKEQKNQPMAIAYDLANELNTQDIFSQEQLHDFQELFELSFKDNYQRLTQNPSNEQWQAVVEDYSFILLSCEHIELDETTLTQLVDYFKQLMLVERWCEYIPFDIAMYVYKQLLNLLQGKNAATDLRKSAIVCLYDYVNYLTHVDGRLEQQCVLYQRLHEDYIQQNLQDTRLEYECIYRLAQTYSAQAQYRLSAFYFAYALKLAKVLSDSVAIYATETALIQQEAYFSYQLCVQDAKWLQFHFSIAKRNDNLNACFQVYAELCRLGNFFWSCGHSKTAVACYAQLLSLLNDFSEQQRKLATWTNYHNVYLEAMAQIQGKKSIDNNTVTSKLVQWQERRQVLADKRIETMTNLTTQPVQFVQAQWSQAVKSFIAELCKETETQLGVAPCQSWAIMCLGPLARDEACLYSDLKFAVIWDKSVRFASPEDVNEYFRRFVSLLEMKVILLGETNKIINLPKASITLAGMTAGLKFDDRGNYPFSGEKIYCGNIEWYRQYLIPKNAKFPVRNLERYRSELKANATKVFDIYMLMDAEHLYGDEEFVTDFKEKTGVLFSDQLTESPFRYREILGFHLLKINDLKPIEQNSLSNIKEHLLKLPQRIVASLALFYGVTEKSTLKRIESLVSNHGLHPSMGLLLSLSTQLAFYWRMQMHNYHKSENDIFNSAAEDFEVASYLINTIYPYLSAFLQTWKDTLNQMSGIETDKQTALQSSQTFFQDKEEQLRVFCQQLLNSPNRPEWISQTIFQLMERPMDESGLRLIHAYQKQRLFQAIKSMGIAQEDERPDPKIPFKKVSLRYIPSDQEESKTIQSLELPPRVIRALMNLNTGHLKHTTTKEKSKTNYEYCNVVGLTLGDNEIDIYLKEHPNFPIMAYASHALTMRLCGHGSAVNTLVLIEVEWEDAKKTTLCYPILVSLTVPGENLEKAFSDKSYQTKPINLERLSQLFIAEMVKHQGDGFARNYVLTSSTTDNRSSIVCVDLEQMFVRSWSAPEQRVAELQEVNIIYCLPEFQTDGALAGPLSHQALTFFAEMNIESLLSAWLEEVERQDTHYKTLLGDYADKFRNERPKKHPFTSEMFFAKGVVGRLALELRIIKIFCRKAITENFSIEPKFLLQQSNGRRLAEAYFPSASSPPMELLQQLSNRNTTVSNSDYEKQYSGEIKPLTKQDKKRLSIEEAKNEIAGYYCDFGQSSDMDLPSTYLGKDALVVLLDYSQVPLEQQKELFDRHLGPQRTFEQLYIKHCDVLDDNLLMQLLNNSKDSLTVLSLPKNSQLTEKTLIYLAEYFPKLRVLVANEIGIEKGMPPRPKNMRPLPNRYIEFKSLRVLCVNRCQQLQVLYLKSDDLEHLEAANNPQLFGVEIHAKNPLSGSLAKNSALRSYSKNAVTFSPEFKFANTTEESEVIADIQDGLYQGDLNPFLDLKQKANALQFDINHIKEKILAELDWAKVPSEMQQPIIDECLKMTSFQRLVLVGLSILKRADLKVIVSSRHSPDLKYLDISGCQELKRRILRRQLKFHPSLEELHANNLPKVDELDFNIDMLKFSVDKVQKLYKASFPQLRTLQLNDNAALICVKNLGAPKLENLELKNAKKLSSLEALLCPALQTIDLTGSNTLTDDVLAKALKACPATLKFIGRNPPLINAMEETIKIAKGSTTDGFDEFSKGDSDSFDTPCGSYKVIFSSFGRKANKDEIKKLMDNLRSLVNNGAKVRWTNEEGFSALRFAAEVVKEKTVVEFFLLQEVPDLVEFQRKHVAGLLIDKKNDEGDNDRAIYYAAKLGLTKLMECLCDNGYSLEEKLDEDGKTALLYAVLYGQITTIKWLIEKSGADINAQDNLGDNAFSLAASKGNINIVRYLRNEQKMDIEHRNNDDNTALILAASYGKLVMVKHLVENEKAKIESMNLFGMTALMMAARNGQLKVVEYLLSQKASLLHRNIHGLTILQCAAAHSHLGTVSYLLLVGAQEVKKDLLYTPLHEAAAYAPETMSVLLESSETLAQLHQRDSEGNTPLHYAAGFGTVDTLKLLLDRTDNERDIQARNNRGFTPLHFAAFRKHAKKIIELLLDHGADVSSKDNEGNMPLHFAVIYSDPETSKLLVTYAIKPPRNKLEANKKSEIEPIILTEEPSGTIVNDTVTTIMTEQDPIQQPPVNPINNIFEKFSTASISPGTNPSALFSQSPTGVATVLSTQQQSENKATELFKSEENCLAFRSWYHPEICHYLLNLSVNSARFIRVIFPDSGDGDNTTVFKEQLHNLMLLSNKLNRPAIFISKEPGASNHFICGIVRNGSLLLVNPLGITTHEVCYQTLAELQKEKILQTIWMSSSQLQRHDYEEEGLVSCGPISVELVIHLLQKFSPSEFENFWNTLGTREPTTHESSGLIYRGTGIDALLPQSLRTLRNANDQEPYKIQLIAIRQNHYKLLSELPQQRAQETNQLVDAYLLALLNEAPAQVIFNSLMTEEKIISDLNQLPAYLTLVQETVEDAHFQPRFGGN